MRWEWSKGVFVERVTFWGEWSKGVSAVGVGSESAE